MWQHLIDQKEKWIGGKLLDYGDSMDRCMFPDEIPMTTEIVDFILDDEYFFVVGKDFRSGGLRSVVGIMTHGSFPIPQGGIAIFGYGSHEFHIVPRETSNIIPEEHNSTLR